MVVLYILTPPLPHNPHRKTEGLPGRTSPTQLQSSGASWRREDSFRGFAEGAELLFFKCWMRLDYQQQFGWGSQKFGPLRYVISHAGGRSSGSCEQYCQEQALEEGLGRTAQAGLRAHGCLKLLRYINHLDPSVNKQLWSDDELEVLYSKYGEYGNKWFLLQKHLPGRTQTKIKNYFYGNIRYFLKIIIKFFNKKSTGFVNDIKTETLLDMYEAKNSFNGYAIIPRTIKKLKYRVEKHACEKLIRENQEAFYNFAQQFMENYTDKSLSRPQEEERSRSQQERESESVGMVRVECPTSYTRVSVVSSVGGEVGSVAEELQHLRRMSMSHFGWYEHYQKAYQALQAKVEQAP